MVNNIFNTFFGRFQLAKGLRTCVEDIYPPLFECRVPFKLPAITTDVRKKVLQILLSARAHGVKEVSICKDMIIQLDTGKRVSVGQYIVKCPQNEDFYINELDKNVNIGLKNPEVYDGAHQCYCNFLDEYDMDVEEYEEVDDDEESDKEYNEHDKEYDEESDETFDEEDYEEVFNEVDDEQNDETGDEESDEEYIEKFDKTGDEKDDDKYFNETDGNKGD